MSNNYQSTLKPFLKDIADAIRAKKGTSATIQATDFPSEIASIVTQPPTGSDFKIHYGTSTPTNTDELWVKTSSLPNKAIFRNHFDGDLGIAVNGNFGSLTYSSDSLCCGAVGNVIYMFGGTQGITPTSTIRAFDTTTGTTTTKSVSFSHPIAFASCAVVGTNCYIIGGNYTDGTSGRKIISKYDTVNNILTETVATLPDITARLIAPACVVVGTDIYIFGGNLAVGSNTPSDAIFKFDTTNNTVTKITAYMPVALYAMGIAADNSDIYIFGGVNGSGSRVNTIYHYVAGSSSNPELLNTTLPSPRAYHYAFAASGKCLIFGGQSNAANYPTDILVFDTAAKTVSTDTATLGTGAPFAGCAFIENNVYYVGGNNGNAINKVQQIIAQVSLNEGDLIITYDANTDSEFKIVTGSSVELYINPVSALMGDQNNIGQKVKIALYNGSSWVELN